MKAIVFPGQGSQKKGMGRELFPRFRELTAKADGILGYSIEDLCLNDPHNELNRTEFTQPAIYATSCMAFEAMKAFSQNSNLFAGHSVGEYAALFAAGAFDFETGLEIVRRRAKTMSEVTGGLAAVVGQSLEAVASLIKSFELSDIEIANVNSPSQTVIGGPLRSLRKFVALCSENKVRAILLPVSGPFHTSHMRKASSDFATAISDFQIETTHSPVYSNTTARPHDSSLIHQTLARHIAEPVQWMATVEAMLEAGAEEFIEISERPIFMPLISEIRAKARPKPQRPNHVATQPQACSGDLTIRPAGFCANFGCRKPLIATSLGAGVSGSKIVAALAETHILSFLDIDGTDLDQAQSEIAKLQSVRGRYGVAISAETYAYCRPARLLHILEKNNIRFVELRGFAQVPVLFKTFLAEHDDVRVVARASSALAIDNFFAYAISRPCGTFAICIDTLKSEDQQDNLLNSIFYALAAREKLAKSHPGAHVYLGVCGLGGNPWSIKSLLAMGLDFVSAGSVLLASEEADVDPAIKDQLSRATFEHFQQVPDWLCPEFGKTTWAFFSDGPTSSTLKNLHRVYLEESDVTKIERALSALRAAGASLSEVGPPISSFQRSPATLTGIRRKLRNTVREWAKPLAVQCEPSMAQWNAWRTLSGAPLPECPNALHMLELLCPDHPHQ